MNDAKQKYGVTADRLKPLEEVPLPDPRQEHFAVISSDGFRRVQLEDYHKRLSHFVVSTNAPREVHVAFDTARNLYLYSWFVYRFSAIAELQTYATLEYALRARIGPSKAKKLRGLAACFDFALSKGWLRDAEAGFYRRIAKRRHEHVESLKGILDFGEVPALAPDQWVRRLQKSLPNLRNTLAHGEPMLSGSTTNVLEICCDLINQLFPTIQSSDPSVK